MPTTPASNSSPANSATSPVSSLKPASMSTLTITGILLNRRASATVTARARPRPSGSPCDAATPRLVVPTASKPARARAAALEKSHALGRKSGSPGSVPLRELTHRQDRRCRDRPPSNDRPLWIVRRPPTRARGLGRGRVGGRPRTRGPRHRRRGHGRDVEHDPIPPACRRSNGTGGATASAVSMPPCSAAPRMSRAVAS